MRLHCRNCGTDYTVGNHVQITSSEAALLQVKGRPGGRFPKMPDLVMEVSDRSEAEVEEFNRLVLESLERGEKRRWFCGKCNNVKTPYDYPGAPGRIWWQFWR